MEAEHLHTIKKNRHVRPHPRNVNYKKPLIAPLLINEK